MGRNNARPAAAPIENPQPAASLQAPRE
jgi:hypothetical protein